MKPASTNSPDGAGRTKDPVGFLAEYFDSSRFEVLSTLEQYDTGAETVISFINKYAQPKTEERNSYEDWLFSKRGDNQP